MVSKYGLRVEYEQYDSYYEARQEGNNCSDGSIVAGDPRHTACLRFGDAQDVYGNSEYAHVLKPQGLFTWTMPRVVMQNVSRARQLLHDMYFYRLEVTHGYIVGQARNVQPKARLPRPSPLCHDPITTSPCSSSHAAAHHLQSALRTGYG